GGSVQIQRQESSGLVGGISDKITALGAQQASEARLCTQKYLKDLLDIILKEQASRVLDETTVFFRHQPEQPEATVWVSSPVALSRRKLGLSHPDAAALLKEADALAADNHCDKAILDYDVLISEYFLRSVDHASVLSKRGACHYKITKYDDA